MRFIWQVIGVAISLGVVSLLMPSIQIESVQAAIIAAVVLVLMNAIVRPIITILTLPITVLTLGFFLLVVNALTYWWTSQIVDGFTISSFGSAVIGALITSIISGVIIEKK